MNMLLIYLFASMKLQKGHKNYLAVVLKLCYAMIFYEIDWKIIRNGSLNKKLNTILWKEMCLDIILTKLIEHVHSLLRVS